MAKSKVHTLCTLEYILLLRTKSAVSTKSVQVKIILGAVNRTRNTESAASTIQ